MERHRRKFEILGLDSDLYKLPNEVGGFANKLPVQLRRLNNVNVTNLQRKRNFVKLFLRCTFRNEMVLQMTLKRTRTTSPEIPASSFAQLKFFILSTSFAFANTNYRGDDVAIGAVMMEF